MLAKPVESHGNRWYPYVNHGGSVVAIAGEDFSLVASDTRLSEDAGIMTRNHAKTYKLTPTSILGLCGFHGDVNYLLGQLEYTIKVYMRENYSIISTSALASLLSIILYNRRFFPLYVSNILAGLDEDGRGSIYSFDPVGSYEREWYRAGGSAAAMLQPILDNQVGYKNQNTIVKEPISREKAIALVKDVFISAAERDVYTGDGLIINIIDKNGTTQETMKLRGD